ncbi:RpiB/LacA/LacB family sugar-phosphate isomerase [Candidatus Nomurabacteria bacterium]|nr:RpiB/LacA/LacB family sugar-phosphate isomerase [Candidatus Nomurabacteria bacterium]
MKIFIASDHAGFELKETLGHYLRMKGREVEDLGPAEFNPEDDYPHTIAPLAKKVAKTKGAMGIAIGGSGQGEAMECNRVKGVRAAVFYGGSHEILKLSRQHNSANVLSLGARFLSPKEAIQAVELWLSTPFSHEERHARRIKELG